MSTLTITAKGQVTLKRALLRHLGVGPGDRVHVDLMPGGNLVIMGDHAKGSISSIFGMLKSGDGPTLTIEEMNSITSEGWSGKS